MTISTTTMLGPGAAPACCKDQHPERLGITRAESVSGEAVRGACEVLEALHAAETCAPTPDANGSAETSPPAGKLTGARAELARFNRAVEHSLLEHRRPSEPCNRLRALMAAANEIEAELSRRAAATNAMES